MFLSLLEKIKILVFRFNFKRLYKKTILLSAGIPAFLSLIDFIFFGVGASSSLLQPLLKPRFKCKLIAQEVEGDHFLIFLTVQGNAPLYLYFPFLSWSSSLFYESELSIRSAWSFASIRPDESLQSKNPVLNIHLLYSNEVISGVARGGVFQHRFISFEPFWLKIQVAGPKLGEQECPFISSVRI